MTPFPLHYPRQYTLVCLIVCLRACMHACLLFTCPSHPNTTTTATTTTTALPQLSRLPLASQVGIPVTALPLADIVLASHKATLHTPFTSLGQSPEAASSVTFPLCMGPARANEMLLLNRKITAAEGYERGLITEVVEDSQLSARVAAVAAAAAALPPGSLQASKGMVRRGIGIDVLREANKRECALLRERWQSEECMGAVMAFLQPKKK